MASIVSVFGTKPGPCQLFVIIPLVPIATFVLAQESWYNTEQLGGATLYMLTLRSW